MSRQFHRWLPVDGGSLILAHEVGMPWQTLRECETKGSARGGQSNLETPWMSYRADPDELKPLLRIPISQVSWYPWRSPRD